MNPTTNHVLRRCFRKGVGRSIHLPDGRIIQGIHLKDGVTFTPSSQFEVIVDIETGSDDIVHLAMCQTAPGGPDFIKPREKRQPLKLHSLLDYAGVLLPVVGLFPTPTHTQRVKEGDSTLVVTGKGKNWINYGLPYVINKPFLVWLARPSLPHPLAVWHFTQEHFKA